MLDTYALIELFRGEKKGKMVKQLLTKKRPVFVSVLSLFELGYVLEKEVGEQRSRDYTRSIKTYYNVVDIDEKNAMNAIELKQKYNLPAVDCLIYSSARFHNAKVVSGCKHFREISREKDIIVI